MGNFICENVFVPLRSGPSHKTEMVSQVLFGEKYSVKEKAGGWLKIETIFDKYSGWIDSGHLQHTAEEGSSSGHILNRCLSCYKNDNTKLVLEAGCEIFNPDFEKKIFYIGNNQYSAANEFSKDYVTPDKSLTDTAVKFLNSPYIWGGRIPSGIDCSGFTQLVYKIHGIPIPRDSSQQAESGKIIDFIDQAEPGDLVFFDDDRGRIAHAGMILSRGLVIHASGRVRIDSIDHQGIFNNETGGYSYRLRMIRRII
jgi:gamma-D-glutamyl-L-lysine dipeptidyl-peptidase